jgi:hypothetical protein
MRFQGCCAKAVALATGTGGEGGDGSRLLRDEGACDARADGGSWNGLIGNSH